ncbi:hypothetical protein [uncultured Dokdonia sp.]|uniref:hypothetical protein n=1 Tax=uncultured Dokdonia sp. TaxID=575653 RepID=UPI00262B8AE9|nr:hypothetical protein [uncultured Dokdonia sp.]
MKTIKFLSILCFAFIIMLSCEQDDLIEHEEALITANSTTTTNAVIIGNRNRLKQRPRRNYKSVIVVDDPTNSVTNAVVQYTPIDGENPFPEPFEMEVSSIRKSIRKMQKTQSMLNDNHLFPVGKPFQQTATLYNELGEPVGDQSETWVTAQDNDGTDINRIESLYLSPSSVSIPLRLRTDQPEGITVFARVELYGRILIKGEPLEMEMTAYDETDGNIGLTGTVIAQLAELTGGSDILPGDELQISITTKDVNGQTIDEDYFITPVTLSPNSNTIRNSASFVFGQTMYVETRVTAETGSNIDKLTTVVMPLEGQGFEPFELELFPVSENENTIKFRSIGHENPTFVGAVEAAQNVIHQMTIIDTDGNIIEEAVQSAVTLLEGITRNPKHIIRPNGTTRIRMRLKNPISQDVAYATMQIPSGIISGDTEEIVLESQDNGEIGIEDKIFRIDGDFVYTYVSNNPDGTDYTTQVTTYNSANEPIGVEDVTFTIEDRQTPYEFTQTVITKNSTGVIRIKGQVEAKPTAGAPTNSSGPINSRIIIPEGNLDGTALEMTLVLQPDANNPDLYNFDGIYGDVNTDVLSTQYETEATLLSESDEVLGTTNVVFDVEEGEIIGITQASLTQNDDGETFTLSMEVSGNSIELIEQVAIFLTPQDGGSDADPEDFILEYIDNTFDGRLYINNFVTFADPESVIDMLYEAEITVSIEGNNGPYLPLLLIYNLTGEE